jgi:Flp pilus assembly protein TadG
MKIVQESDSGQSLLELALVLPMLLIFVLGIVDFTRAIYDMEVITNLAGEGSSAASRETTNEFPATVAAIMNDADINMANKGCAIITSVSSGTTAGTFQVTGQSISTECNSASSKIGCFPPPSSCGSATIPSLVQQVLQSPSNTTSNTTYVAITEVYYNFTPITPIGTFLHNNSLLPTQLYAVAYY